MTYRGHVKDGVVVLDEPAALPEGASVEVAVCPDGLSDEEVRNSPTLYETLKDYIGIADDLPADFAENHDHYIHGAPKK